MSDTWAGISPQSITGFSGSQPGGGSGGVASGVDSTITTAAAATPPLYSPQNPLFWFGVILAAAAGLFHLSTHVKSGPASASVSI